MNLYDKLDQVEFKKPIRLIELFAGYGSQALSLKYSGLKFEHYKISEWAINSINAYKDIHFTNDNKDYSKNLSKDELVNKLYNLGISKNYNEPMTKEQIQKQKEEYLRQTYNSIKATNNLVDITSIKASDLEIIDTDKYDYVMTYSFPCQDLSIAGNGAGISKDTRSGMLYEVDRILEELDDKSKPKVLLMENVTALINKNHKKDFDAWIKKLEKLGYTNYWTKLRGDDYGIPQTRERIFMLSVYKDNRHFEFPEPIKLTKTVRDYLEKNVDDKYFLSKKKGNTRTNTSNYICEELPSDFDLRNIREYKNYNIYISKKIESSILKGLKQDITGLINTNKDIYRLKAKGFGQDLTFAINKCPTLRAGGLPQNVLIKEVEKLTIRKLTPREYFRLMGVKDQDFDKISYMSNSALYHLAGDSIITNVISAIFEKLIKGD